MVDYTHKAPSDYLTESDLKKVFIGIIPQEEFLTILSHKRKQLIKEIENYKDKIIGKSLTKAQLDYLKKKRDPATPEYLNVEDLDLIKQYYARHPSRTKQIQYVMIRLMAELGLRVQEVCDLEADAVDDELNEIRIFGKGEKWRKTKISDNLIEFIKSFKQKYQVEKNLKGKKSNKKEYTPLFVTAKGKPFTPRHIQKFMETLSKNIPELSMPLHPHMLRHTYAVMRLLYEPSLSLEDLRGDMGHTDIRVTQIYFRLSEEDRLRRAKRRQKSGGSQDFLPVSKGEQEVKEISKSGMSMEIPSPMPENKQALAVLKMKLANMEISIDEYEQRKRVIES
ncbi:MAG: tyrosine-type recombinase/integrase [Nanoarchaeota archaeon]|nr:tyrosine-type recombinase/integrase [Nanoarchaeota archaeon]